MRDAGAPFAEFIAPFLAPGRGLGEKSRRDYARYLREFDAFTGHTDLRTALTLENGQRFRDRLKERGRSASRNGTMYLKSLGRWLAETRILARSDGGNLLDPLKPPKTPKTKRQALTEEDLDAIWAVLADRPRQERYRAIAFVRLLEATGLRRSEVGALLFNDIEFDDNGQGGWVTTRTTRRNVGPRRIRLDAEAVAAIRQYIDEERPEFEGRRPEPLFLNKNGKRFRPDGFGTWVAHLAQDIEETTGIKWSAELMRHTWAEEGKSPFRDADLRNRCMEILNGDGNYDQAVMAACKVLEERVRVASGAPLSLRSGVQLMKFALGGDKPPLRLSTEESEQRGAMEMYAGLMSYYRNPAAHRIRDDLDKDEVTRIVSWVDHLLTLVGRATASIAPSNR